MNNLTPDPIGYIVVAEILHGPVAEPVFGQYLHLTVECAAHEMRDMAIALGWEGRGASFELPQLALEGWPLALAVTEAGQMWAVRIHEPRELRIEG
nr:hypothetical protein OH820_15120 [Streptomyces sp. NBC_00857]